MTPTAGPVRARIVPMDEDAARGLSQLVRRRPDAIGVPSLCTALLHDYCGTHKRECAALVNAVAEDIPAELRRGPGHVPADVWFDGLVERLVNNRAMSPEAADWSVRSWAEALGVPQPQAPAGESGPQPPPPVQPGATGAPAREAAAEGPRQGAPGGGATPPQRPPTRRAPRRLGVALLIIAAVPALYYLFRDPGTTIKSIRFFEAARDYRDRADAAGNPAASPSHFRQDETRAVWAEINLARPAPKDTTVEIVWRLSDGTPKTDSVTLSAGTQRAVAGGYGWEEVGHWQVRTYEVEFSIAGKKVASERFVIDAPPRDALSVKAVRFYESDESYPPLAQRRYKTHFWQDATRYVNFQLDFDRPLQKRIEYKTTLYYPDGGRTGAFTSSAYPADLGVPYIGHGWRRRWEPGAYRVDFMANGVTIASKKFIVEPPLEAQTAEFYASDPSRFLPFLPSSSGTFPRESTTYVWYKLELSRPVTEDTTIVSVWHRPNGTEASEEKTLKEGSKTVSDGRGNGQAGSLLAGAWRVDFFLDNKKIATRGFVVTEAPKAPVSPSKPQPRQGGGGTSGLPKPLKPCPPGQHPLDFLGTRVCVQN
jgi:hypothetical protein